MNIQTNYNTENYFIPWRHELNARITSTLPIEGKLVELAKRITMVVIYPFISFLALLEKGYSLLLRPVARIEAVPTEELIPDNVDNRNEPAPEIKICQDFLDYIRNEPPPSKPRGMLFELPDMSPEGQAKRAAWRAVVNPLEKMFSDEIKRSFEAKGIANPKFVKCNLKDRNCIQLHCLLPRSTSEKVGMKFILCENGGIITEKTLFNHASYEVSIPLDMNLDGAQFAEYCKNKLCGAVNYLARIDLFLRDSLIRAEEVEAFVPSRGMVFGKLNFKEVYVTIGESNHFTLIPELESPELRCPLNSPIIRITSDLEEGEVSLERVELLESLKMHFRAAYDKRVRDEGDIRQNGFRFFSFNQETICAQDVKEEGWTRLEELSEVPGLLALFRANDKVSMQAILTREVEKRAWLRLHPDKNNGLNGDQFDEFQKLFQGAKAWMNV